jgi:flavin-dependent dehydrogenase
MVSKILNSANSSLDCAVMIVGGGPAGISTWLHLQKYDAQLASRALLIEKAIFPRDKLCAGGVGGWSPSILEDLEVDLDIPSLFIHDLEFKFGEQRYFFHQANCFRLVQRIDFDHALVKAALNRGLDLHENEMLIDVIRSQNRLIVKTNRRKHSVQILIGADGALSAVRRKMTPPHKPRLAPTIQIFSTVNPEYDKEFHKRKMLIDFTPVKVALQGYVWHFPCLKDGVPSMVHGICDFRLHRDKERAAMKEVFRRELQSRNIDTEPRSWSSHPIHLFSDENILSQPNVLLVGDAAGIEPAFGGGIHLALSYGEVAARAIIDAFQNNDFFFHDYQKKLKSHLLGGFMANCTRLALDMYGGRINPLDAARKLFSEAYQPAPDLISMMLSEVEKALRTS